MTRPERFLSKEPQELAQLLVHVARSERAPTAARQRALASVAGASALAAAGVGAKASTATGVAAKSLSWLAFKWFAVALSATAAGLGVIDYVQRAPPERAAFAPRSPRAVVAEQQSDERSRSAEGQGSPPPALAVSVVLGAKRQPATGGALAAAPAASPRATDSTGVHQGKLVQQSEVESSVRGFSEPSGAALTRELVALKQARSALAQGAPAEAERILDGYRAEFPRGALSTEEAALRVEAVLAQGNRSLAAELASRFLKNHPTSPLAARVRTLSEGLSRPDTNR